MFLQKLLIKECLAINSVLPLINLGAILANSHISYIDNIPLYGWLYEILMAVYFCV